MAEGVKVSKDLRYLFIRGLIAHEKSQRSRHYLKSAAECTSRAIVSLELSPEPITTVKQAKRLEGIGGETCTRLARLDEERNFSSLKPLYGRCVSSAGAILVTLLDMSEEQAVLGVASGKDILIPESRIKTRAGQLCEEPFIEEGHEGFCVAWWRIEVLIKRGYIKRRSQKKTPCLQLLPAGREIANRLRGPGNLPPKQSKPGLIKGQIEKQDYPMLQNAAITGNLNIPQETSLFTNDTGDDGVVLQVDTQEMGGARAGLGELCGLLAQTGVCYRTKKLATGDYGWIWRHAGEETILPCLAERKRADDIPGTLKEGRFWSQINRMLEWKRGYTDRGIDCHIHYILERKPEEYVVKCVDGCQGIVRCGNPTLAQIKMVIEDLKHHPQLLVKETDSLETTVVLLKSLTEELIWRSRKGEFDVLLKKETHLQEDIAKTEVDSELREVDSNKREIRSDVIKHEFQTDLSFEEQMKMALANSLKQMNHDADGNYTNAASYEEAKGFNKDTSIADNKNIKVQNYTKTKCEVIETSHDVEALVPPQGCGSKTDLGHSDIFMKPVLDHGPLMQHHCTVESSITCQSSSREKRKFADSENEYRPTINRNQSNAPSSPTLITSLPKPYLNDWSTESHDLLAKETEIMDAKKDEILDSLRRDNYTAADWNKLAEESVVEDLGKLRPSKRFKQIKLDLTPSKLYVEPNTVKVRPDFALKGEKLKSIRKLKGACTSGLKSTKSVQEASDEIDSKQSLEGVINSGEGTVFDVFNISQNNNKTILQNVSVKHEEDTTLLCHDENGSFNSVEDIFADGSGHEMEANVTLSSEKYDGWSSHTVPNTHDGKVSEWLTQCKFPDTIPKSSTIDFNYHSKHQTQPLLNSVKEESDDSLPDIKPCGIEPENFDNESVVKDMSSDAIALNVDDAQCIGPGSSRVGASGRNEYKKMRNERKRNDSGYRSGDVQPKSKLVDGDDTDLDSKIATVLAVLPHAGKTKVKRRLQMCAYNVEQCISVLLDDVEEHENTPVDFIDLTD